MKQRGINCLQLAPVHSMRFRSLNKEFAAIVARLKKHLTNACECETVMASADR